MGQTQPLFVLFCPPHNTVTNIPITKFDYKSVDGVRGIQTQDRRMVGKDESTELWLPLT